MTGDTLNSIAGDVTVTSRSRRNVSNLNTDMTIADQSASGAGASTKMSKMAANRQATSKGRAKDKNESLGPGN